MGEGWTQAERLSQLASAIVASPHNLVSSRAKEELETRHIPECLSFARMLGDRGPVLDLGAGGGLPGLVTAIARPDLDVHLLEATAKKASFLEKTAALLGVTVQVHHGRAEELSRGPLRGSYGIVTARAVAPLERLIGWAEPYLAADGYLYAIKGERWAEEVEDARSVLARRGLAVVGDPQRHPHMVPDANDPHRPRVVMIARRS